MSWTKKNVHPGKIVSTLAGSRSQGARGRQRKASHQSWSQQAQSNPWADFADKFPVGTEVEGEVKNSTEFGLFIGLPATSTAWFTCGHRLGVSGEDALGLHHKA